MKVLCPQSICGSLIGKGGSVITGMMQSSSAKIRISQSTELFPDTTERIAVVSGVIGSIMAALELIINKILEV